MCLSRAMTPLARNHLSVRQRRVAEQAARTHRPKKVSIGARIESGREIPHRLRRVIGERRKEQGIAARYHVARPVLAGSDPVKHAMAVEDRSSAQRFLVHLSVQNRYTI